MRKTSIGLLLVGLAGIIFGAVWMAAVFPGFKKIPTDYDQTIDFQGTYAVVADQDFLQQLLASPAVRQVFASPQTLQLLTRPETQQVLASEALKGLLANPALLQQILANPAAAAQAPEPIRQVLANPVVQALLADPVVRQLLADPQSLALLTDARTLRLLADPTNLRVQEIPVNFHRVRTAERTQGNVLFLHQDFAATVAGTGQPLPQFSSTATLAVDRSSREYVAGGSEPRTGGFAFPFDVKRAEEYPIWIHEVFQPLAARYVETANVQGQTVYVFRIQAQGLALPSEAKKNQGVPEALDLTASVDAVLRTEPKTGITIDLESDIRYTLNNPLLGNPTVFRGRITYTDQSVLTSVDDARDARRSLYWFGTFLPWSALALGVVLLAGGLGLAWSGRPRKPKPSA